MESDMEEKTKPPSELLAQFTDSTTMHGAGQVKHQVSIIRKMVWVAVILGCFVFLVVQLVRVTIKFYEYPTRNVLYAKYEVPMKFPAVTICNLSPVRQTEFDKAQKHKVKKRSPFFGGSKGGLLFPLFGFGMGSLSKMRTTSISKNSGNRYTFTDAYNALNISQKMKSGTILEEFLVDCEFGEFYCKYENFTAFIHPEYGNCFTFNGLENEFQSSLLSERPGPQFGLSGTFFIDQQNYAKGLTESVGLRVVIHDPNNMPFPEEQGYNVAPGTESHLAIKSVKLYRLPHPYEEDCKQFSKKEAVKMNMYSHKTPYSLKTAYTQEACIRTCLQMEIERKCKCSTNHYAATTLWKDGDAKHERYCRYQYNKRKNKIGKEVPCAKKVQRENEGRCLAICNPTCESITYTAKTSYASWPSQPSFDSVQKLLKSRGDIYKKSITKAKPKEATFVKDNFVKLLVYFEDSYVDIRKTEPAYEFQDVVSDIGGNAGLFLGLSLLTIVEMIQLILDLGVLLSSTVYRKVKSNKTHKSFDLHSKS